MCFCSYICLLIDKYKTVILKLISFNLFQVYWLSTWDLMNRHSMFSVCSSWPPTLVCWSQPLFNTGETKIDLQNVEKRNLSHFYSRSACDILMFLITFENLKKKYFRASRSNRKYLEMFALIITLAQYWIKRSIHLNDLLSSCHPLEISCPFIFVCLLIN